ncbi:MAG: helix-turn-helix domain-containing protein [Ruminococcaceae bacterium]|nr:helix-turn-helix domain-containing protein [Oscillospiraceae bacterium]
MDYSAFEHLLKMNNTTVYRVSKETGIAASTFTDWKNGRSCPKADKLKRIAAFFDVSLDELLGTQTPRREVAASQARRRLPIIGEIRAGSPIITNETLLGYESADVDDVEEYFYLKVCGDSMKDCGMVDGSLVLFHKQQYAENGDIVACLVGGDSATVKRFFKRDRRIILQPENEEYSPIELSPVDFETGEARILGVAQEVKIKL